MKRSLSVRIAIVALFLVLSARAQAGEGFKWLTVAPEIGYVHYFKTTIDEQYDVLLPARNGMVLKGHVDIGGDGIALELAPLWELESAEGIFGKWSAVGGEITVVYRGAFGDFYPGVGIGLHCSGIIGNDAIKSGAQLFARVPLGFTWYFAKYLGLVFEGGIMFGGTGLRMEAQSGASQDAQKLSALAGTGDIFWGSGFAFDIMAGLRFP